MELTAPAALWLWPLAVAVLLALQLIRSRRHEIFAGSLMIWRRVAARDSSPPPRRFLFDRAFWLQAAVLGALTWAWAGPVLKSAAAPDRQVVLLIDNGPTARVREQPGVHESTALMFERIRRQAHTALAALQENDRVLLVASSPAPKYVGVLEGAPSPMLSVARARELLADLSPALSSPGVEEAWAFAEQTARGVSGGGAQAVAISPREGPAEARTRWQRVAPAVALDNVGLTAFGSRWTVDEQGRSVAEVLVQVRAFGTAGARGRVHIQTSKDRAAPQDLLPPREVTLSPNGAAGVAFTLPHTQDAPPALRIEWRSEGAGSGDVLPEDDALVAVPRAKATATVRFHGEAPHVKALFESAAQARVLDGARNEAGEAADLDIFVEALPEDLPTDARAVLLLAPPAAYEAFDVGGAVLKNVRVLPGAADALTEGMVSGPEGLSVRVTQARELIAAGDMDVLWRDEKNRPLAARFRLRDRRPGYVLAFVPGEGPLARKLPPSLAALLVRMLNEAQGAGAPYAVRTAREVEAQGAGVPLAWDWSADLERAGQAAAAQGVLDAEASALPAATAHDSPLDWSTLMPVAAPRSYPLWPWLVAAALVLLIWEAQRQGRTAAGAASASRAAPPGTGQAPTPTKPTPTAAA